MKKVILIIFLLVIAISFVFCPSKPTGPTFVVSETQLAFSNNPEGEDIFNLSFDLSVININDPVDWSIDSTADWVTIDPASGTVGTVPIIVTVSVNDPFPTEDKNDTITISSTDDTLSIEDVIIDITFTFSLPKDDVYMALLETSFGMDYYYVTIDADENVTDVAIPSGSQSFKAYDIFYDYDWGTETGDVYIAGRKTDWSDNDRFVILKNNSLHATIDPPTGADTSWGSYLSNNDRIAILNGVVHSIVGAKVPNNNPGGDNIWTHYHDGTDYYTLPSPTSGNTYKIQHIQALDGNIYIYGYEKEDESWIANEIKPLAWIYDGSTYTVEENFPTIDTVLGAANDRTFDVEDLALASNGDILIAARLYDDTASVEYAVVFRSDNTYELVGSGTDTSANDYFVEHIASEDDYIIKVGNYLFEDEVYIDGQLANMEEPENIDAQKKVEYVKMLSDGEDAYSIGHHQYNDTPFYNKAVVYRNSKIILDKAEINFAGTPENYYTAEDFFVPRRPSN